MSEQSVTKKIVHRIGTFEAEMNDLGQELPAKILTAAETKVDRFL